MERIRTVTRDDLRAIRMGESKTFAMETRAGIYSARSNASSFANIEGCTMTTAADFENCTITITKQPKQ